MKQNSLTIEQPKWFAAGRGIALLLNNLTRSVDKLKRYPRLSL